MQEEQERAVEAGRPARAVIATRSFIFADMDSAQRFEAQMSAEIGNRRANVLSAGRSVWDLYNEVPGWAQQHGGQLFRSTGGRETRVYGFQQRVYERDREYLLDRDPTAGMLITQYDLVWNGLPRSYVPEVDAYFAQQMTLGLLIALQAAYQERYQEGGAFIYLETSGDPAVRLRRGERPLSWTFLPSHSIFSEIDNPDHSILLAAPGNVDPLLDHGIEELSFYPTEQARAVNQPMRVHGSRLIPVNLDPRSQRWWREKHIPFNQRYDTLWEFRDFLFTRVRAQFQGDPIIVEVDLSQEAQSLLNLAEQDEDQRNRMSQDAEQGAVALSTGAKSTIAPTLGFKHKRLGAAQLPDPKEDLAALASRLSHGSLYPVKFFLASTKGANDIGDQDLLILQGNVQNVRNVWGYKHLAKALLMGQIMGVGGLRMQDQFNLPPAADLDWPLLRPLSPRDAAFTEKTDIAIYREAQEASVIPPARLRRKFPEDPRRPIPLWMAVRGRDTDGNNTDTAALNEPGAAGDQATPTAAKPAKGSAAADAEYQAWLESRPEPVPKRPEDDAE